MRMYQITVTETVVYQVAADNAEAAMWLYGKSGPVEILEEHVTGVTEL